MKSIKKEYELLKSKFIWNVNSTKWFKFKNKQRVFLVGIDRDFNISMIYQKKEFDLLRLYLEDTNFNFNIIPNYIYIGNYLTFGSKDNNFKALYKDKRYDYQELKPKQISLVEEMMLYLSSVLEGDYDLITTYDLNCWFEFKFDDVTETYLLDLYEFNNDFQPSINIGNLTNYNPSLLKDESKSLNIDMFYLELPVYSYELNKVVNPLIVEIISNDSYYLKAYLNEIDEMPNIILDYIKSLNNSPKHLMFFNKPLLNSFMHASKNDQSNLGFLPYNEADSLFRISFVSNLFKYYKNEIKDKGFIELDELNTLFEKLMELYSFLSKNTDEQGVDPYLIQAYSDEYFNLYQELVSDTVLDDKFKKLSFYFKTFMGLCPLNVESEEFENIEFDEENQEFFEEDLIVN